MVSLTPQQKKDLMKSPAMKELKRKYDAKMKGKGMKRMKGMGWWDTVGKAIGKNAKVIFNNIGKTAKKAYEIDKYLRDSKIISKVADGVEKGAIGLTAIQPELIEFTAPVAGVAELVKDTAKSVGYGKGAKMKMGGKGLNRPLTVRPKGVSVKVLKPPKPTLTIRRDGVFEKTAYPTHVAVQPVKMKGRGVRPGTFNTVYSEYGKTKGL